MKRSAACAVFILLAVCSLRAQNPAGVPGASDPWSGLRFLVGTWHANTQGGTAGAQSSGLYSFQLDLRDHVMARRSIGSACKSSEDFDCEHSDLLYIYPAPGNQAWHAIYLDNEGHVIQYTVTVPKPGTAEFLTDPTKPGPQFRLVYTLSDRTMTGKFQAKMPGQSDFVSYLEWSGKPR